ncbi:MAG: asparaginase [Pseudomonadota bacterium]
MNHGALAEPADNKGILIIYTGGTIGCAKKDPNNSESPLNVVSWKRFIAEVPQLAEMGEKFRIKEHEITPPLDSTNMSPENWKSIANIIGENYTDFEGFVVLHGTDTMVYTASALSFMLENLNKPVILTGSQLPIIGYTRTDGVQNLVAAVEIANAKFFRHPIVPEVCILFNDVLLRGNRSRKRSASGFKAFESPNFPPLGTIGEHININPSLMLKRDPSKQLQINDQLEQNVAAILLFPGIQESSVMHNIVKTEGLKGLVLLAYGTGNVPTSKKFLGAIDTARKNKQVVLDVTQSNQGSVELGVYETSAVLLERGVVSGSDITPEAALCKLMVLLGNEDYSIDEVMEEVQTEMAGEQSRSVYSFTFSDEPAKLDFNEKRWRKPIKEVGSKWPSDQVEKVLLRLYGAHLETPNQAVGINLSCFIGIGSKDELDPESRNFAGKFSRGSEDFSSMVILDITDSFRRLVSHNQATSFTLALENDEEGYCLEWEKTELSIFTNSGAH